MFPFSLNDRLFSVSPPPVGIEVDVPYGLRYPEPADDERLAVWVDHVDVQGVPFVQADRRVVAFEERAGGVQAWGEKNILIELLVKIKVWHVQQPLR